MIESRDRPAPSVEISSETAEAMKDVLHREFGGEWENPSADYDAAVADLFAIAVQGFFSLRP
jgi:hypothetical protein